MFNETGPYPEKEELFHLLFDQLHQQADELYIDTRTIEFSFSREEYAHLDKMLEKINRSRDPEERFSDLAGFIRYQLGEALEEAGEGGLFSAGLPQLRKLAVRFKERALSPLEGHFCFDDPDDELLFKISSNVRKIYLNDARTCMYALVEMEMAAQARVRVDKINRSGLRCRGGFGGSGNGRLRM